MLAYLFGLISLIQKGQYLNNLYFMKKFLKIFMFNGLILNKNNFI
jgi:hypothetical protein